MPKTLLLISQVYVPDPAAVGQYMAEAAGAMVERGWKVRVLTADRGYDDPSERFPSREERGGVSIRRLPFSSLGKASLLHRLAGQLSFCAQAVMHGLFTRDLGAVLVTTSPPMGGIVGWALGVLRRAPVKYWVMDINPDQALALGQVSPTSPMARLLEWGNRRILARASDVIDLDVYMERTMRAKLPESRARFHVIPPWPMEQVLRRVEHADNPFRREHGMEGKFVFMYSGNHSPVHPLTTVLEAALHLRDREDVLFVFIGGGLGKEAVEAVIEKHRPRNILSLPYQPLDRIQYSLSAADVHLVSMGDDMVGIVHPCKFYGAMALAKPVLLLGPERCHVADVLARHDCGWQVRHGDVDAAEEQIRAIADLSAETVEAKGRAARVAVESELGKPVLAGRFAEVIALPS